MKTEVVVAKVDSGLGQLPGDPVGGPSAFEATRGGEGRPFLSANPRLDKGSSAVAFEAGDGSDAESK
ncbi:hypothetical protein U1Q18_003426, partial [Sarracenia purpurea var. burkii]